jgi:hypothetical protein
MDLPSKGHDLDAGDVLHAGAWTAAREKDWQ